MNPINKPLLVIVCSAIGLSLVACQTSSVQTTPVQTISVSAPISNASVTNQNLLKSPWSNPTITSNATDAVYRQEWLKAESKLLCPILALPQSSIAHLRDHSVRRANFSSGWGVAYDLPNLRSAYGVANAGTVDPKNLSFDWPFNINYQDDSTVGYGHEGGNPSAKWLAYIIIPQNDCFYNVWSAQGKAHLEQIITDLRIVKTL